MLNPLDVRAVFAQARELPPEWLDEPGVPRGLRKRLEALERDLCATLPDAVHRLRGAVEAGDDVACVEARASLARLTGVNLSSADTLVTRVQGVVREAAKLEARPGLHLTRETLADYLGWLCDQATEAAQLEAVHALVAERCVHLADEHIGSLAATRGWVTGLQPSGFVELIRRVASSALSEGDRDRWRWRFDAETGDNLMARLHNGKSVSGALWEGFEGLEDWASRVPKIAALAEAAATSGDDAKLAQLADEWSKRTFQGVRGVRSGLNRAVEELMSGACAEEFHGTRKGMRRSCVAYVRWLVPTALADGGFDDALLGRLATAFPEQRSTLTKLQPTKLISRVDKRLVSQLAKHEKRHRLHPIDV